MTIFSMAIDYMRRHLMSSIENSFPDIKQRDVMFVITVPAIWSNASKQFMREAAVKVCIYRVCLFNWVLFLVRMLIINGHRFETFMIWARVSLLIYNPESECLYCFFLQELFLIIHVFTFSTLNANAKVSTCFFNKFSINHFLRSTNFAALQNNNEPNIIKEYDYLWRFVWRIFTTVHYFSFWNNIKQFEWLMIFILRRAKNVKKYFPLHFLKDIVSI